ncbi:MAG: hypothetical protein IK031_02460 [Bacteroidales bacterium]|nr:hypothetical protein [Bacteroidales bacterium]
MRKTYSAFALAALVIAGCTTEKEFAPASGAELVITATRDASTRTAVQSDGKQIWWSAAEKIDVFYAGQSAVFTGQNAAPAATAEFRGSLDILPDGETDIYAVYPSSSVNAVDGGVITLEVPITQNAVAGTFADNVFPAVAVSKTSTMSFKNVAGGIKFSVSEPDVTEVVIEANGDEPIAGVVTVVFEDGVPLVSGSYTPSSSVTVVAPQGGFDPAATYYAALLPAELGGGITFTLKRGDKEPVVIASDKKQSIKRGVIGKVGELAAQAKITVTRVWGKYSTEGAAWNEYFGGVADSDRNFTMDDDFIYVPETSTEYAKIWKISKADPSVVSQVTAPANPTGYFKTSAARVMDPGSTKLNGGKPMLIVSNMVMVNQGPFLKLYIYNNGTDNAPSEWEMQETNLGRRLGDIFTIHGTFADGGFMFKDWDKVYGNGTILVWRTAFTYIPDYYQTPRNPTWNTIKDEGGRAAFYPYPGQKTPQYGIYTGTESAYFVSEKGSNVYTWNAAEFTAENAGGYYVNASDFNFFEFNGKRYIAYAKNAETNDGRFYILEGEASVSWQDLLSSKRKVIYQASIQQDLAFNDGEYHVELEAASPRQSGNSGLGCTARVIGDEVYICVGKQNVGLSLFKMTVE